jgi:ribosome modulation factor
MGEFVTPYDQGYADGLANRSAWINPHSPRSEGAKLWANGWRMGQLKRYLDKQEK